MAEPKRINVVVGTVLRITKEYAPAISVIVTLIAAVLICRYG